jgi:sugar phosphate permease
LAVPYSYSIIKSNVNKTLLYILVFGYALFYMTRVVYAYNPNTLSNSQGTIPYVFIEKTIFLY